MLRLPAELIPARPFSIIFSSFILACVSRPGSGGGVVGLVAVTKVLLSLPEAGEAGLLAVLSEGPSVVESLFRGELISVIVLEVESCD